MDYIKFSYVAFEFGTEDAVKVHVIVEKLLTIFNLAEQQLFTHTQTHANTHTHIRTHRHKQFVNQLSPNSIGPFTFLEQP